MRTAMISESVSGTEHSESRPDPLNPDEAIKRNWPADLQIPDLESRLDRLIALRRRDLVLPPDILALYRTRTINGARKMLGAYCVWVALINALTGPFDLGSVPTNAFALALGLRVCISVSSFSMAWLLARGRLRNHEYLALFLPCLIMTICAGALGAISGSTHVLEIHMMMIVIATSIGILYARIDVRYLAWLAASTIALISLFIAASGFHHIAEKIQLVTFCIAALSSVVYARKTQEIYQYGLFILRTREELRTLAEARRNEQLASIAFIDPLTQIHNRRYFEELCAGIGKGGKTNLPFCLCLLDIDLFKNLNDVLGHLQGDRCLRVVATAIRNNLRGTADILARYGGEEFVILLPNTTHDQAQDIMERVRAGIADLNHPNPGIATGIVTISIGIAAAAAPFNMETVINNADQALYCAKSAGRNRVFTWQNSILFPHAPVI